MKETRIEELQEMMENRPEDAHKGMFGHVLLICGSEGMTGAAVLCARASLRSGAGLVTVSLPKELFPIVQIAAPEAMCLDRSSILESTKATGASTDQIGSRATLDDYDAIAIGCGMGATEETYRVVEHVLLSYNGPVVIDADGINALCGYGMVPTGASYMDSEPLDELGVPRKKTSILPDIARKRKSPVILTPHPGEASRLFECLECGRYGEQDREESARILAETTGAIIVLKGCETIISTANANSYSASPNMGDADVYINRTGNPGMATGGSGDVLTGVIAATLAAGHAMKKRAEAAMNPISSVRAAVYIHGRAGDMAADNYGETGMVAGNIIEYLPEAFKEIIGR